MRCDVSFTSSPFPKSNRSLQSDVAILFIARMRPKGRTLWVLNTLTKRSRFNRVASFEMCQVRVMASLWRYSDTPRDLLGDMWTELTASFGFSLASLTVVEMQSATRNQARESLGETNIQSAVLSRCR